MNRLFIIGNGFDIAHGLSTKYNDFINYYWSTIMCSEHNDGIVSFKNSGYDFRNCKSLKNIQEHLFNSGDFEYPEIINSNFKYDKNSKFINYHNHFFYELNCKFSEAKWVDIEMEYYRIVRELANEESWETDEQILKVNQEFELIKGKFEEYLTIEVEPQVRSVGFQAMAKIFEPIEINRQTDLFTFLLEFPSSIAKEIKLEIKEKKELNRDLLIFSFGKTMILNFNYTSTIVNYIYNIPNTSNLYIHGKIGSEKNPINFGFGDEMDNHYKIIENRNNNNFLKFIKSFAYSNNWHYNSLLDFINVDKFQVEILGHSCGISDRTLLNTIFEHPNCSSIKVFYHKYQKNNGILTDNYTDIIQNISRHFKKKKNMREKVMNKTICKKLPQFNDDESQLETANNDNT